MNVAHDPSDASPGQPADLSPLERPLADLLGRLPRETCGPQVRDAVLASPLAKPKPAALLALQARALSGLRAAAVVVAVGAAVAFVSARDRATSSDPASLGTEATVAHGGDASFVLYADPGIGLMYGLETFDRIGLADADLLADWGR